MERGLLRLEHGSQGPRLNVTRSAARHSAAAVWPEGAFLGVPLKGYRSWRVRADARVQVAVQRGRRGGHRTCWWTPCPAGGQPLGPSQCFRPRHVPSLMGFCQVESRGPVPEGGRVQGKDLVLAQPSQT